MKRSLFIFTFVVLLLGSVGLTSAQTAEPKPKTETGSITSPTILSCVWNAVEKREQSVATAFSAKTTTIQTALTQKNTSLRTAWSTSAKKERFRLIAASWRSYRASVIEAKKIYQQKVKDAWKGFREEKANCGSFETSPEAAGVDIGL